MNGICAIQFDSIELYTKMDGKAFGTSFSMFFSIRDPNRINGIGIVVTIKPNGNHICRYFAVLDIFLYRFRSHRILLSLCRVGPAVDDATFHCFACKFSRKKNSTQSSMRNKCLVSILFSHT